MGLRTKVFLFFSLLMMALLMAQWFMLRQMTEATVDRFGEAALALSRQLADYFEHEFDSLLARDSVEERASGSAGTPSQKDQTRRLRIIKHEVTADNERITSTITRGEAPADDPDGGHELFSEIVLIRDPGQAEMGLRIGGPHSQKLIALPSVELRETMNNLYPRLLWGTMAIMGLGMVVIAVFTYRATKPLIQLSEAARRMAAGDLGVQVSRSGSSEVKEAILAFNAMSLQLAEYDEARQQWRERQHLSELGEIARGLAHTLRNPLNTLGLLLEEIALRAKPAGQSADDLVIKSRTQINRIDNWIRSFLCLADHDGDYTESFHIKDVLSDIILEARQQTSANLEVDIASLESLPVIDGVSAEVRGIIHALAINAVEAVGDKGLVRIRADSPDDSRIVIEISDDGPGLPEEVRKRLFSPHVSSKPWGAGMGIFLAHRITTTRYAGSLDFFDNPPQGTLAKLTIATSRSSQS